MSEVLHINSENINNVDVDDLEKEYLTNCDRNPDSGIDSRELSSATLTAASDSEVSPLKHSARFSLTCEKLSSGVEPGNESYNTFDSLSPTDPSENLSDDILLLKETTGNDMVSSKDDIYKDDDKIFDSSVDINVSHISSSLISTDHLGSNMIPKYVHSDLNKTNNRNLTTSTISLNESVYCSDNSIMCKSPYSRSAENITNIEETQIENISSTISSTLDTEQILSDFSNQKTRVSATHKIPESQETNNSKHNHLRKEILSQDLGSIVKNVHGIFWSVSGNLKNAYTQRVAQKAPVKNLKPVLNGKVMNDIFEDAVDIQNAVPNLENKLTATNVINTVNANPKITEVNGEMESDVKMDMLKFQNESLERLLSEQRKENVVLRERVKQLVDDLNLKDQTFRELETKLDLMSKRVEQAQKDADAAVMRYAGAECAAIEGRKAADAAKRAQQAAVGECELLSGKLRSAHAEKQRICQLYDDKCHELQNSERETAKLREDLKELEGRLKWTQSKLRMEMDAYKESSERVDKLTQQVAELEVAKEAAAAGVCDSARAKVLEGELKESQAALILCRHEKEELERRLASVTQQLETCKRERDEATVSLSTANDDVEKLKVHNLRLEEEAAELAALRAQAALADTLSSQLQRETERATRAEAALSAERARAETCARREAAALEHAARLTAQHVAQRARTADHEARAQALSADNVSLRERAEALQTEVETIRADLAEEGDRRQRENRVLARKVAELTEEVAELNKKLEWEKGENSVLKKKHSSAIKELNRELQRALKRSEQLETKLQHHDAASTRTGSVTSLSSGEGAQGEERPGVARGGSPGTLPDVQSREPERQVLIERIVSLQRAAARRAERCEFLEEHARQLTGELRGKARLLRHLLAAQPAGAVASPRSDANKKEIAQLGGGAMAAVWGGDPGGMTPELSLEMNKRLQALLEDTLLKNITLKENIDTLGEEIARLKSDKAHTSAK